MIQVPTNWSERNYGGECFWLRESENALILLGLGPALSGEPTATRLRRLASSPGFPFRTLAGATQVHGSAIAVVDEDFWPDSVGTVGNYDGLMTAGQGCGLAVWTADCVPILLDGGVAVSAVHAGWRGTAAGILPQAIGRFQNLYGVNPVRLSATIGPGVGSCHYPVGSEVIQSLERWGLSDSSWRRADRIDLRTFLHLQLLDLGVPASAVEIVGPCTACDHRMASFRRDGLEAGRQISIIGRRTKGKGLNQPVSPPLS